MLLTNEETYASLPGAILPVLDAVRVKLHRVSMPKQKKVTAFTTFEQSSSMKLHLAGLDDYDSLLYLDVDMTIIGDMERKLDLPETSHVMIGFSAWNSPLHGGILSPRPSQEAYDSMRHVYKLLQKVALHSDSIPIPQYGHPPRNGPSRFHPRLWSKRPSLPWEFASAHHDRGLLYWWYALRRGSFLDLFRFSFYDHGGLDHNFLVIVSKFVPHMHFGGSPKPWSEAL